MLLDIKCNKYRRLRVQPLDQLIWGKRRSIRVRKRIIYATTIIAVSLGLGNIRTIWFNIRYIIIIFKYNIL